MKTLHQNILERFDQIINDTAIHIHDFIDDPHAFTRKRSLDAFTVLKMPINMQGNCLSKEIDDALDDNSPNGGDIVSVSAYVQQKAKLSPKCFEHIFHVFNDKFPAKTKLNDKYFVFAFDGTDLDQLWNPKSQNRILVKNNQSYCQIHNNAMYNLLDNTYQDCILQAKAQMDERGATLRMLKRLDCIHPYIAIMDRGYESFNLIENCNRLPNCYYVIRARTGGIKEISALPDKTCNMDITCRVTISNHYYTMNHKKENIHLISHVKHHYKTSFSKNTRYQCWDFGNFCDIKFRACKIKVNDPDTGKEEWEVLLTNLDRQEFPLEQMKELYHLRWGIESSFRKLKYDLGSIQFHSKQDRFVEMEIYAHMAMFNVVSLINNQAYVPQHDCKYQYMINFKMSCSIVHKRYPVSSSNENFIGILIRISKYVVPIRPGRKDKRNLKAKSAVYYMYRVA